jgi:uncharacterized protein (UPF0303 family)
MAFEDDIRLIKEQEKALVFPSFDEAAAFAIGTALRERGIREGLGIVADVRTWERHLFYMALPGSTGDNQHWVRRKANLVQRRGRSSYRSHLEQGGTEGPVPPAWGLDNADYVLRGGGFPVVVKGVGLIGAVTVSGLHERDDHQVVVDAICVHLKVERGPLTLAPRR